MPISQRWVGPIRTGNSVNDTQINRYSNTLSPQTQRIDSATNRPSFTDDHHQSRVKTGKKNYYKCLPWHAILATIFFMLAISAVIIPTLLAVLIKTNYFSSTNNTKCVNLTAICSTSVNYSDPCNGNIPISKYISNREVYCRRDATSTAVLGYYFSCAGYAPCSQNTDCGQDGYCDQYCAIRSCGGSCNPGLGNCAKLATGLNCGITLSD